MEVAVGAIDGVFVGWLLGEVDGLDVGSRASICTNRYNQANKGSKK